ncbi:MAG: ion transporter [Planctomycetes bacterium]|nr:ion transporter [Planctomycetota bacterium]
MSQSPSGTFPGTEPPAGAKGFAVALARLLDDSAMGVLALLALSLALVPVFFHPDAQAQRDLDLVEWLIVALFATEYVVHWRLAPSRRAFLTNRWRLLDLGIILVAVASLLPHAWGGLRASPALRLLQVVRAFLLGTRSGGVMIRQPSRRSTAGARGPLQVSVLGEADKLAPRPAEWEDFLHWSRRPGEEWVHLTGLDHERLAEVARFAGLSLELLESVFVTASYPRIKASGRFSILFVWLPSLRKEGPSGIERHALLLLLSERELLSLTHRPTDLQQKLVGAAEALRVPGGAFATRMAYAALKKVVQRYEDVAGQFEQQVRALEDVPVRDSRPEFLERAFLLKREMSAVESDLWRLHGILEALAEGRATLKGGREEDADFVRILAAEAEYLHETVENLREGLLSLLDLHLNVVSFEMNKVMRVLAVVSVLGLFPSVVGGILGMNVQGSPWAVTLPQVVYGVGTGLAVCLYFFYVKGWLR